MQRVLGRRLRAVAALGLVILTGCGTAGMATARPASGQAAAANAPAGAGTGAAQGGTANAGGGGGGAPSGHGNGHGPSDPSVDGWAGHGLDATNPQACDPVDPAQCMLPYPNDWFTKPDPSSHTGRRLDLVLAGMPRNVAGKPVETQEWNRSDGFSAGAQILTLVPGMTKNSDVVASGMPPVTNLGANDTLTDPGVILLDTATMQRVPVWVEVDQYTDESGPVQTGSVQQDLMIHPAVNLSDGHHYVVGLRHVVTDDGSLAQPSAAFAAYRNGTASASDPRAAHYEHIFQVLQRAGWKRNGLYLAWDFTTASTANVTGRLLAIRDDALAQLHGGSPAFTVDSVSNDPNAKVGRRISGHFTVPCYIFPSCDPPKKCGDLPSVPVNDVPSSPFNDCPSPGQFLLDPTNPDAVLSQVAGQTYQANFICNAGSAAFHSGQLMRPVEYGHGLFGSAGEVNSDPQVTMANDHAMMYCATDWFGMAAADIPNAVIALSDLSRFPLLTDRVQQGELDFLYLQRLMASPQGLGSNAAFQFADGRSFIDTTAPYYDGNSQGGIFGGTVCAVSVDVHRCVLGVPGMDYSILLPRSSDYVATKHVSQIDPTQIPNDPTGQVGYSNLFDTYYPDQSQRMLLLDLIQTLWDRSDPDGYASHMRGGLPNTPHHEVLLQAGYGDHQVANITAEDEARTIGAAGLYPPLVPQRYGPYQDVFWGIPAIATFPYAGSAITLFDSGPTGYLRFCPTNSKDQHDGTDPPPPADTPNRSGEDPHEAPRRAPYGQQQKSDFLQPDGMVTNPQPGGAPYFSWCWDGVSGL